MLGEQADLQVQRRLPSLHFRHAVLADEHERGEEDRFDRRGHAEHDELWVPGADRGNSAEIRRDPEAEQRKVNVDEGEASSEACDLLRQPLMERRIAQLRIVVALDRLDVAIERGVERSGIGRRHRWASLRHAIYSAAAASGASW